MKKNYKMKKTVSMKQFVTEFGEDFSKHMKQRLMELGTRCVLTRKEESNILDLKHVEHTKYECNDKDKPGGCRKEYAYGQFIMNEGCMYFSENCVETPDVMQAPVISDIYDHLNSQEILNGETVNAKKVDDENIDYVVDKILEVCPEMSPEHLAIISRY